jgi:hypothetical protein
VARFFISAPHFKLRQFNPVEIRNAGVWRGRMLKLPRCLLLPLSTTMACWGCERHLRIPILPCLMRRSLEQFEDRSLGTTWSQGHVRVQLFQEVIAEKMADSQRSSGTVHLVKIVVQRHLYPQVATRALADLRRRRRCHDPQHTSG